MGRESTISCQLHGGLYRNLHEVLCSIQQCGLSNQYLGVLEPEVFQFSDLECLCGFYPCSIPNLKSEMLQSLDSVMSWKLWPRTWAPGYSHCGQLFFCFTSSCSVCITFTSSHLKLLSVVGLRPTWLSGNYQIITINSNVYKKKRGEYRRGRDLSFTTFFLRKKQGLAAWCMRHALCCWVSFKNLQCLSSTE